MDLGTLIRSLFRPWVIIGALLIAILLFGAVIFAVVALTPPPQTLAATAEMVVIPAPSLTPTARAVTPTIEPTATNEVPPLPSGSLAIGDYIQITGTEGDGLRIRVDPGLGSEVRLIGAEAEVFQVTDGPRDIDGYTWWYLIGPYDDTRRGWAVANYLLEIQNP